MKYSTAAVERGVQQSREGCPIFLRDSDKNVSPGPRSCTNNSNTVTGITLNLEKTFPTLISEKKNKGGENYSCAK